MPAVELDAPIVWLSCASPCDSCPLTARCRDEKLACAQFSLFYRRGGEKWKAEPREPSRMLYQKIFPARGEVVWAPGPPRKAGSSRWSQSKRAKARRRKSKAKAKQAQRRGPPNLTVREICASHAVQVP
jgi:hypothetical protein